MNAQELCDALRKSGTGQGKVDAAEAWAEREGKKLRDVDGKELLREMSQRDTAGAPWPWPEGTQAKAKKLLDGEEVKPDQPIDSDPAEAPGVDTPPHVHAPREPDPLSGHAPSRKERQKKLLPEKAQEKPQEPPADENFGFPRE